MSKHIFVFAIFITSVGCVHHHWVEEKEQAQTLPEGYRVDIGSSELKSGDKVQVFRSVCEPRQIPVRGGGMKTQKCKHELVGEANVLKIMDHDSAIIAPDGNFQIEPKMIVEKKP